MDKNKNRTDLLAAGRKKLQQYRQKKDGKGSKPVGKANKPDRDVVTDESSSAAKPSKGKKQLSEVEAHIQGSVTKHVDSSSQEFTDNLVATKADVMTPDLSFTSSLPIGVSVADESIDALVPDDDLQSSNLDDVVPTISSPRTVNIEGKHESGFVPVTPLGLKAVLDEDFVRKAGELNAARGEDQVPDVGAMQEHDCSCSEPDNRTSLIDLEGDMNTASSMIDENAQFNSGDVEEDTGEGRDGFSAFASEGDGSGATISDVHSVSGPQFSDSEPTVKPKEVVAADVHGDDGIKLPPDVISGWEDTAVSLTQLSMVFQSLGEDEFRFLVAARESGSSGDLKSDGRIKSLPAEFSERLKEQLYISNLEKELIYLQLCEEWDVREEFEKQHLHWVKEKSAFSASLGDVEGQNKILSEELAICRSELGRVTSEMENLQMSFSSSKTELERSSSRIDELQIELNSSEHQLLNVSSELVDSQSLLLDLQVKNENLNANVASLTEQKNKLEKEKGDVIMENEKLTKELMECKSLLELSQVENVSVTRLVEALQVEIARLNEVLMSERDERSKLEEANDQSVQESKKFLLDLLESQHMVENLRLEISNLSESLDLVTKERTKFMEEMNLLSNEKEAALTEVTNCKTLMKDLQVEYEKSMNDGIFRLEQLTEEYVRLTSTLDMYKARITEFDDRKIKPELRVSEDSLGFMSLKRRLSEVEKVMQELDKAIAGISDGKAVSPGVSKLVRNFELKGHIEESEESPLGEDFELHITAKKKIDNLKDLFRDLVLDAENASELFKVQRSGNGKLEELMVLLEAMKERSNSLEETFFKHVILEEFVKQYVCTVEAKKGELVALCEDLRQEGIIGKMKNSELTGKLCDSEARICELQLQVDGLCRQADHMDSLSNQLETLQRKLDATIGTISVNHLSEADIGQNLITRVATSVDAAIAVIQDLRGSNNLLSDSYKDMAEKTKDLEGRNELAAYVIHKVFDNLQKLVNDSGPPTEESEDDSRSGQLDHLEISNYDVFIERLIMMLRERAQLESMNREYNLELLQQIKDIEELNKRCIHPDIIVKLLGDIQSVVTLDDFEIKPLEPVSSLESIIHFFVMRNKSAEEQVGLLIESLKSKETKMIELQNHVDHLSFSIIPYEIESRVFKESLRSAMEQLVNIQSETHLKENELHQSEQRVSALREKLHIAVTKGKGLIQQRDSLKQNLTATSSELEKCLHELQLKETALQETETKLKLYSEAGERMEALESELSYIRNSATALRESFLLKDSVLQRIEEILEDLELPEDFHVRDIIDKIDWLAKSVSQNSFLVSSSNHMSSIERSRSYPESRSGAMDGWNEVLEPTSGDDELRRNYEDLQNKFYRLAEQNEMLEQSLMERNNLVQRWEEVLDKISIPLQLRSLEPEDRIEWLSTSLSEANDRCDSLQRDICDLEKVRDSLSADLEESQRRLIDLEAALHSITDERERLSSSLEVQRHDYSELLEKAALYETKNDKLQNEVGALQLKLDEKRVDEEHIHHVDGEIRRLQDLVKDMLQIPETEDLDSSTSDIQYLAGLLRKLADKYTEQSESIGWLTHGERNVEQSNTHRELDLAVLERKLEEVEVDLVQVKDERDRHVETNQSLVHQLESLEVKNQELQKLLVQEEQKSAAVREKLNVAVRKGKSLVQQRDGMKQTINDLTSQVERLNAEIKVRENTVLEYQQKMKDLITSQEVMEEKKSEFLLLKSRLSEADIELQDKKNMLSMIVGALAEIDLGVELRTNDPVEKLHQIAKVFGDLQVAMLSAEQDSRKSKRAAELLLIELNEVQERNEDLLEELSKTNMEISELSKERDSAEAAKREFVSRLEHMSALHLEERSSQLSELRMWKSRLDKLRPGFGKIYNLLNDVLPKDLDHLYNLEASVKSLLESSDTFNVGGQPLNSSHDRNSSMSESKVSFHSELFLDSKTEEQHDDKKIIDIWRFVGSYMQDLMTNIREFEEKLQSHSKRLHEEVVLLSETMTTLHREMNSDKSSLESVKEEIAWLESTGKQKETENLMLRKYLLMLYEACKSSVFEIEKSKGEFVAVDSSGGEDILSGETLFVFEERITSMVNRLLSLVKDFHSIQAENLEANLKEMKATISSLQKELTEKDVQKDRISVELVSQIKRAEAAAMSSLQELEPAKALINDLKSQLEAVSLQRNMLEQKVKELEGQEYILVDLHEKVESLTSALTTKEQEAEALLQALDEEEAQMEELTNKVNELERAVQQKDLDLETAEAARGKALKKLSITVSKFDELHHLSETLVSEVDKLQSKLQERDTEISFLRDEITRCTSDFLLALETGKRDLDEIQDILTWLNSMISGVETYGVHLDDNNNDQVHEYKERLKNQISSIILESKDLRQVVQSKDDLLNIERSKVEDLMHRQELLENSLREKESRLSLHQDDDDSARVTSMTSEIVEVEPVINKWPLQGTSVAPQVRSLRKVNNEQLAISIDDMDSDDRDKLEDEDDDKAHGFKSLTTSKLVPKFTRPVTNFIDGLWVSCDRALMRQPVLRLSLILYWALMHALLAVFVV